MLQASETRTFIARLFDTQPDSVVWYVPVFTGEDREEIADFEVAYCNRSAARLLNAPASGLLGKRLRANQLMDDHSARLLFQQCSQAWQTNLPVESTYYNPGFDKYFSTQRTKVDGGVLSITRDRTGEVRSERERQQQDELYRQILNATADGILFLQSIRDHTGAITDFRLVHCNQKALEVGRLPANAVGRTVLELLPHLRTSEQFNLHKTVVETGRALRFETTFRSEDSTEYGWFIVSLTKMDDGVISTFVDVSAAKETQRQLERSLAELKRSNESLDEFTRTASHDLKEPIRKVQFFAERLRGRLDDNLNEESRLLLERMEAAAARMKTLVDDLLAYSHVNEDSRAFEDVDLNVELRVVLSDLELVIAEKDALVRAETLPAVRGIRQQLLQLFHNLLSNAVKYSRPGTAPVVRVRSQKVSGAASGLALAPEDQDRVFYRIEVEDNGIGFEPQYADKIFNVFTRLHGNSEYSGTGVGLAIVQKVVKNHHGYVSARSTPGQGAVFQVLLPA